MPGSAWSDPATEELLGLAVDLLAVGDGRGITLLAEVLTRECGGDFARTVSRALRNGAAPAAFDFLPPPTGALTLSAAQAPVQAVAAPAAQPRAPSAVDRRTRSPAAPSNPLPHTGYITAAEVAAHFGVSSKAVYRWMASGRIRAERRPGGSYRIPAEQFHPE